jgi:nucleoside 2-deoxyribosyltransferase
MAVRICVYLSQRDHNDSPPGTSAEVVYETLIMPVMESFPDFRIHARGYIHETGSISTELVKEIAEADLVIADLTDLSASGYFELGVRYAAGLPTVLIGDLDYVMPVDAREFELVRYPFDQSPQTAGDADTIESLVAAIREALNTQLEGSGASHAPMKKTAKEKRYELAERIEATAEAIRLLRSNTTGDAIAELQAIAEELKSVKDAETPSALKEAVDKALKVLLQIMDQLSTVRGSRMAISGTIALVVGGAGWSAVTALGLGLAFWEGKEAFLKAMEKLGKK